MASDTLQWQPWQALNPPLQLTGEVLAESLDGGQSFRWERGPDGVLEGVFGRNHLRVRSGEGQQVEYSCPEGVDPKYHGFALAQLLDAEAPYKQYLDALPWRSDPVLEEALERWRGLRLLRQEPGEALLGFLCSSTKQIVQIKQICRTLAETFGERLVSGTFALPTWEWLAEVDEAALRACKMGYRARYIAQTAQALNAAGTPAQERLTAWAKLDTPTLRQRLEALPGVGRKVADCVLLFGFQRLEAFPMDTWIFRILSQAYGLSGWKPDQLQQFAQVHFGPKAGLAQQYLFSWARGLPRFSALPIKIS